MHIFEVGSIVFLKRGFKNVVDSYPFKNAYLAFMMWKIL